MSLPAICTGCRLVGCKLQLHRCLQLFLQLCASLQLHRLVLVGPTRNCTSSCCCACAGGRACATCMPCASSPAYCRCWACWQSGCGLIHSGAGNVSSVHAHRGWKSKCICARTIPFLSMGSVIQCYYYYYTIIIIIQIIIQWSVFCEHVPTQRVDGTAFATGNLG